MVERLRSFCLPYIIFGNKSDSSPQIRLVWFDQFGDSNAIKAPVYFTSPSSGEKKAQLGWQKRNKKNPTWIKHHKETLSCSISSYLLNDTTLHNRVLFHRNIVCRRFTMWLILIQPNLAPNSLGKKTFVAHIARDVLFAQLIDVRRSLAGLRREVRTWGNSGGIWV